MSNQTNHQTHMGAEILIKSLLDNGTEIVFGYPGGAVLPIFDALYRLKPGFKNVLCRHEQGLIHAAEGYARVTGKPGVVLATSGPGMTNLLTGIADALLDSLPVVIISGQVTSSLIGTDGFQEADAIGLTTPITKHNYRIHNVEDLPRIINEAFHIASTGRPGPVVVDIPKDVMEALTDMPLDGEFNLPGYQPTSKPHPAQINRLIEALKTAERPVILVGAGVITADASEELAAFIDRYPMPVVNTFQGIGAFDQTKELSLNMAGMHGGYAANHAIDQADLLINIGSRFDDRLTGATSKFAPNARVAHIDIDPAEIGKNIKTKIPVVADAKQALQALLDADPIEVDYSQWNQHCLQMKADYPFWYNTGGDYVSPQYFIEKVAEKTNHESIVVTDVGQHQMWAAQFVKAKSPNKFVSSGGLGTMGFGIPAAIGCQLADPEAIVNLFVGDGGFQMSSQELATIREYNLPIKIFILNNESLGMVRQWQELIYDENYSQSILTGRNPDFLKLAESYGIKSMQLTQDDQIDQALEEIYASREPILVDVRIDQMEKVYPMVMAGSSNTKMIGVENPCKE